MCEKADLTDREVLALCSQIVESQETAIKHMKALPADH